jgi:hypothetical protein
VFAHDAGNATQPYEGGLQHAPPSLTLQYSDVVLQLVVPQANVIGSLVPHIPVCARGLLT